MVKMKECVWAIRVVHLFSEMKWSELYRGEFPVPKIVPICLLAFPHSPIGSRRQWRKIKNLKFISIEIGKISIEILDWNVLFYTYNVLINMKMIRIKNFIDKVFMLN